MAYTVNRQSGAVLTTIADGTIDNTTDLTLIGKNYSGYGELLNENFVKLLENFSNTSAPDNPVSGQLWWDATDTVLKAYTGTGFKVVGGSTNSSSAPANSVAGDLWFNNSSQQLYVSNGATENPWILVGPSFTVATGESGGIVEAVTDNLGVSRVIVKLSVNDTVVGIVSKDSFTPQTPIAGFTTISPGIQLSSAVSGASFNGDASLVDAVVSGSLTPDVDGVRNLGEAGTKWDTVYAETFSGTASEALYADLAERFEADAEYAAGTVVSLGGDKEVTAVNEEASDTVFGVVSGKAAYLMNARAGTNATHPAIAMTGRVPVRVIGTVLKGQRLISSNIPGVAKAAQADEVNSFNVVGRALEDKYTQEEGTVLSVVKIN